MILNTHQLDRLSAAARRDVTTPEGANVLMLDIETVTGVRLGLNTVKRLVGVLHAGNQPRVSTLNAVARYLGYSDWEAMQADTSMGGSGFGREDLFTRMADLPVGTTVSLAWPPDRSLRLRHLGEGRYEVLESHRGKLRPGDTLTLSQLAVGFPFTATDVRRADRSLGHYHAAEGAGLTLFDIS